MQAIQQLLQKMGNPLASAGTAMGKASVTPQQPQWGQNAPGHPIPMPPGSGPFIGDPSHMDNLIQAQQAQIHQQQKLLDGLKKRFHEQ